VGEHLTEPTENVTDSFVNAAIGSRPHANAGPA
jgi:hypothetical protein